MLRAWNKTWKNGSKAGNSRKRRKKKKMEQEKKTAIDAIEQKASLICEVADRIWDYAELSLQEVRSAALYCEVMEKEGFHVEKGICGIETAFSASYGSGRPLIGILAEYDALSGLSQEAGSLRRKERTPGGSGHGCGHNLLGAGAFAAALGVKAFLEKSGCPGTVVLYGCPGEEGGAAKAFMARDGVWRDLDAALTWHPEDVNEVETGSSNSCIQVQYEFTGVASHAYRCAVSAGTYERPRAGPLCDHRRRRMQSECRAAAGECSVYGSLQPCLRGGRASGAG